MRPGDLVVFLDKLCLIIASERVWHAGVGANRVWLLSPEELKRCIFHDETIDVNWKFA